MKPLHEILGDWAPAGGHVDPLAAIRAQWTEVVGADVATSAQPLELKDGTLLVVTRSGAWSQQLTFLSEQILAGLRSHGVQGIERLRFRIGRIPAAASRALAPLAPRAPIASNRRRSQRQPTQDAAEAMRRFRDAVETYRRAKRAAGWKECQQCGVWIAPQTGPVCRSCVSAHADKRAGTVARLLYDTPWLGLEGAKRVVADLGRDEYEAIRKRLLKRWWDILQRSRRAGHLSRDGRERLVASSYVLLKTGIDPERIASSTVRNELGDELYAMIYGTEDKN